MESGRSAGTGIIGVSWGMAPVEELLKYNPLGVLENWYELKNFI
jgi:phosphoglycolate phosphatase-like HAD superfamily hydrolase